MKIDYASLLNEAQLEAVTTSSQHVRIIAGAGSGKTRVLTYRIAYLIDQWGADPYSILAVTFTNKAANEMKERVEKLIPGSSAFLTVSTFHSFCARFLRKESHVLGYPSSFTILDDEDSDKMIVDVLVEMGYKKKDPFVKTVKNYIGRKKTLGIYPDDIKLVRETFHDEKKAIEAYREYETKKYQMFAFDFDDLLLKTLQILEEYPEIREKWSNRFSYLLVDEFQDTNNVQYRLLKDLCTMNTNVYVVGDPDQTIYTWRGANQGIILDFPREFPDYTDIVLDRNYRSTESILKAANKLIAHNKKRVPKNLYTEDEEGEPIITKSFESAEGEAKWIAKKVSELVREGSSYSDIAILYRAAYLTRSIESALAANRIPYRIFGGLRFYQRKEVKDVKVTYTVINDRTIRVDMDYQPTATDRPVMPKFGMRMRLPKDFTQIKYYGRGPWENYPDRKGSAFLGIYEMPLSEYETEYIHPQDNGNRCDIRWFEIGSLRIEGLQPLCIRAWDYGEEDLEGVRHPNEINRGRFVNLNIDLSVHGVGGADTWGKRTLPQYTIDGNQPHHYSFFLSF